MCTRLDKVEFTEGTFLMEFFYGSILKHGGNSVYEGSSLNGEGGLLNFIRAATFKCKTMTMSR